MPSTAVDSHSTSMIRPPHAQHSPAGRSVLMVMLALQACLAGCGGVTFTRQSADAFDDESKTWQELALQLPAAPQAGDQLPFDVDAVTTQRFAVDAKSISTGADGVVRYTLTGISLSGARNVTYEGVRCASYEQKVYAVGHEDGSWAQARRSEWSLILTNGINRQQAALARDYLCMGKVVAGSAADIVRRLRQRQPLSAEYNR